MLAFAFCGVSFKLIGGIYYGGDMKKITAILPVGLINQIGIQENLAVVNLDLLKTQLYEGIGRNVFAHQ